MREAVEAVRTSCVKELCERVSQWCIVNALCKRAVQLGVLLYQLVYLGFVVVKYMFAAFDCSFGGIPHCFALRRLIKKTCTDCSEFCCITNDTNSIVIRQ